MLLRRLQEIRARRTELLNELNGDVTEERMAEIEQEQSELEVEERQIQRKLNLRGRLGKPESQDDGSNSENDVEARAQRFVETRGTTIASGQIAVPTHVQNDVNAPMDSGNSILNLVYVQDCSGMGSNIVPYEKPGVEAGTNKEGESTTSTVVFDYAEIKPVTVDVYTEVSRETRKLTPVKYMEAVQRAAMRALRKKIGRMIVSSDAAENTTFFGINKAKACQTTKSISAITATTLRDIILAYGGDDDVEGSAVLILTKADLQAFGAVRGEAEKKAVYEIIPDASNPNTGIIKDGGLSCRYTLNSGLKSLSAASAGEDVMYYGKPAAYEVDIFSDYTITVSEDAALKNRMIAVLGEVMVGGNVTVYNGFIKIQKA